jgi:hypothetical protein
MEHMAFGFKGKPQGQAQVEAISTSARIASLAPRALEGAALHPRRTIDGLSLWLFLVLRRLWPMLPA